MTPSISKDVICGEEALTALAPLAEASRSDEAGDSQEGDAQAHREARRGRDRAPGPSTRRPTSCRARLGISTRQIVSIICERRHNVGTEAIRNHDHPQMVTFSGHVASAKCVASNLRNGVHSEREAHAAVAIFQENARVPCWEWRARARARVRTQRGDARVARAPGSTVAMCVAAARHSFCGRPSRQINAFYTSVVAQWNVAGRVRPTTTITN